MENLPGDFDSEYNFNMTRHITTLFILLALMLGLPLIHKANAQSMYPERETKMKVAYLFNFTKFINWPDEAFIGNEAPLIICVLGNNPFGRGLQALESKTVRNRRVEVHYCSEPEEARGCHLLFISSSESLKLDTVLTSFAQLPMVTVSDIPNFVQAGGMIEFMMKEKLLRFAINLDTARLNGLQVHSQLSGLATRIVRDK